MLIINGVRVKPPKSFQVAINDIDGNTARNANGTLVRDRITTKRKLECEWGLLTQTEAQQILHAVDAVFFNIQYIDPKDGIVTKTFYVGDRTSPAYSFTNKFKPWSGLKMNFIEE